MLDKKWSQLMFDEYIWKLINESKEDNGHSYFEFLELWMHIDGRD